MVERTDIPLGYTKDSLGNTLTHKDSYGFWEEYTYDSKGKVLTHKDSDGFWYEYTYDSLSNELTRRDSDGYWYEYTRDSFGNVLSLKDSIGFWEEYTRDSFGNVLTYKDSDSYWYEYTRDSLGKALTYKDSNGSWYEYTYDSLSNVLTHKNSNGFFETLVQGQYYILMYDKTQKLYKAGCQVLDFAKCKKFFKTKGSNFTDSGLFMKTIENNERVLNMNKYLSEMLYDIDQDVDVLNSLYVDNENIKILFSYCFNKSKKFNFPNGDIKYKKSGYPEGLAPVKLINELKSLDLFLRKDLSEDKLIGMFVGLLENLSEPDANILIAIKNQNLNKLYPRINLGNIKHYGFIYD